MPRHQQPVSPCPIESRVANCQTQTDKPTFPRYFRRQTHEKRRDILPTCETYLDITAHKRKYLQYCSENIYAVINNDADLEGPRANDPISEYCFNRYQQLLENPTVLQRNEPPVATYSDGYCTLYFCSLFPLIDNDERMLRFESLVFNLSAWLIPSKLYFERLRQQEAFQLLWHQVARHCPDPKGRTLLLFDLHLCIDMYVKLTLAEINGAKSRSHFDLLISELAITRNIDLSKNLCSNQNCESQNNIIKKILNKLNPTGSDLPEVELIYDLKLKREFKMLEGVTLTAKDITILEPLFLKKAFSKHWVIHQIMSKIEHVEDTTTMYTLVSVRPSGVVFPIIEANVNDVIWLVRMSIRIKSLKDFLRRKKTAFKDSKTRKSLSELKTPRSEAFEMIDFRVGTVTGKVPGILYLSPHQNFSIIPHYRNYNNHIEIGLTTFPEEHVKQQALECLEMHSCASDEEDDTYDPFRKLSEYVITRDYSLFDIL